MQGNHKDIDRGQFTDPIFFGRKSIILLIILLIAGISWYFLSKQLLIITPKNINGKQIVIPLEDEKWHISYTHSVQQTTVVEYFKLQDHNQFVMYRTKYSSFGVGLPFLPNEGELIYLPDNTMQLDLKTPRIFPVVKLWTGIEAKVSLTTGSNTLQLYQQYPTGTLIEITTCKRYQLYIP